MRIREIRTFILCIAAGLVLAGCADEPGTPSTTNTSQSSIATSQPSNTPGTDGLTGITACDLLTESELQPLGLTSQAEDLGELGGAGVTGCQWQKPSKGGAGGLTLTLGVRPGQSVDSVVVEPGWTSEDGEFEGRKAKILKDEREASSSCMLAIAVGSNARVDTSVIADSQSEACDVVNKVATIIEPKLPKNGG